MACNHQSKRLVLKLIHPTTEYIPIRIIVSDDKLLWQILGALNKSASTTAQVIQQQKTSWQWDTEERRFIKAVKKQWSSAPILKYCYVDKLLSLACEVSLYENGPALSQALKDKTKKLIAFALPTLSRVETRYSKLDKEALAISFGTKRFHHYLYGRSLFIVSDHKPLQYLVNKVCAIPTMASALPQRGAVTLSAYQNTILYFPGVKLANADTLSRLPLTQAPESLLLLGEAIFLKHTLQSSLIMAVQVKC